jgi:cytoskeletal protein CcmA (bactofilin family)/Zn finger protein HypA/HybF involved in hydrogenase expression
MGKEIHSKRIELTCPSCGHQQLEPAMVISTQCRSCSHHINVQEGKAIARPTQASRLSSMEQPPVQYPVIGEAPIPTAPKKVGPSFFRKFFEKKTQMRSVDCYHCGKHFEVVSDAQSSQCPKCGGYISLRDFVIASDWRRRIQTRGDVMIRKTGSIIGVNVQCNDLTVLGNLSASVDCSGLLLIRSHGKIIGNVKCRELRIERGAEVEFLGDVFADTAYIDGHVKARITCKGSITLEKKAQLQGLARAASLLVKEGAKHTGLMEIVKPQT